VQKKLISAAFGVVADLKTVSDKTIGIWRRSLRIILPGSEEEIPDGGGDSFQEREFVVITAGTDDRKPPNRHCQAGTLADFSGS